MQVYSFSRQGSVNHTTTILKTLSYKVLILILIVMPSPIDQDWQGYAWVLVRRPEPHYY